MDHNQPFIKAGEASVILRRSPLLNLPGGIRNRIYDLVFGTKALHPVPEFINAPYYNRANPHERNIHAPSLEAVRETGVRNTAIRGLYKLRQTCRQIASETEHYLFYTLDLSNLASFINNRRNYEDINAHHKLCEDMLEGRWHHVHHMVIASYAMAPLLDKCQRFLPEFPLPTVTAAYVHKYIHYSKRILWPADARDLTTLTIHDMHKRTAHEREVLLKVLGFYFPKLEDVRCSYEGDTGCMRRYRISNGELKWWYTGELFKALPEQPTMDQWFGTAGGMMNVGGS